MSLSASQEVCAVLLADTPNALSVLEAASIKKSTLSDTSLMCLTVRFAPADGTVCLNILENGYVSVTVVNKLSVSTHTPY